MRTLLISLLFLSATAAQESRQATGVKVGEVSTDSALVWMRRTAGAERNHTGMPRKGRALDALPADAKPDTLEGAVPGAPGRVRVRWAERQDLSGARSTSWVRVTAATDYCHTFRIDGLRPSTRYHYAAETEGHAPLRGSFRTPPPRDRYEDVTFTVITGQMYAHLDHPQGFHIYEAMLRLAPEFIVPTGDNVYYDNEDPRATTVALARYHWQRMYSLPRLVAFHLRVPGYWEKDDHDILFDDCYPGMRPAKMLPLTFEDGQRIFREQTPVPARPYRTVRWGKALEVWLTEGRDFRSPNNMPDGPQKTIWGEQQKRWLKESLLASDADWKVLVSPTPVVGPDRANKGDNHANKAFHTEGSEFRRWAAEKLPRNFFIACGDRHWQYHSVDPATGVQEFSSGPASDEHASGSPGENREYHQIGRASCRERV